MTTSLPISFEIHPVTGTVVDPQFGNSLAYRLDISRVSGSETLNSDLNSRPRVEVAQAAGRVKTLRRSLAVLRQRELPAAERAVAAERASLGSGGFDLASWLASAAALRVARVDEARMQGDIEHAIIDVDASVGKPLSNAKGREERKR